MRIWWCRADDEAGPRTMVTSEKASHAALEYAAIRRRWRVRVIVRDDRAAETAWFVARDSGVWSVEEVAP